METTDKKSSIYLTLSESEVPIRLDWPVTNLTENILKVLFIEYMDMEIAIASKTGYIPDNRIQRYDLPGRDHLQKIIDELMQGGSITDLLDEHSAVKRMDISFRVAYFHDKEILNVSGSLPEYMENMAKAMMSKSGFETKFNDFKDECKRNLRLNSYITEKGIVSFDNSWYGDFYERAYFQNLADNYFDPQRGTGCQLNAYKFDNPTKEQTDYAVSIYKHFNILNLKDMPGSPLSKDLSLLTDPSKVSRWDMGHTFDDYRHFTEDFNLESTPGNKIIHDLLYIKELGYPRDHDTVDQKVREDFKEIETRLTDLHANDSHNDKLLYELLNKSQLLADNILKERYKIEGKPIILRNSDQIILRRKSTARPQNKKGSKIK